MTIDEAIAEVESRAAGRTQYEGREPPLDEVLVAEIERLRKLVATLEISAQSRLTRVVRLTCERGELMAALDRAAPQKARELAQKFKTQSTET
jgi:hypothetical protein